MVCFARIVLTAPSDPAYPGCLDNSEGHLLVYLDEKITSPSGEQYVVERLLGRGCFGHVYHVRHLKGKDNQGERAFAIKIVRAGDANEADARRERDVHDLLQSHATNEENIHTSKMIDSFHYHGHFCLLMSLHGIDLCRIMDMRRWSGVPLDLVQIVARALLRVLCVMRRCGVVHSDIKLENIVTASASSREVALIDFGSSRFTKDACSFYIQTRYYRAPEVVLGIPYGHAIDMWSVGCVLAEITAGFAPFLGHSELQLMELIVSLLGPIPREIVGASPRGDLLFTPDGQWKGEALICREMGIELGPTLKLSGYDNIPDMIIHREKGTPENEAIRGVLADLVMKMLELDQTKRITPEEALKHPFMLLDLSSLPQRM